MASPPRFGGFTPLVQKTTSLYGLFFLFTEPFYEIVFARFSLEKPEKLGLKPPEKSYQRGQPSTTSRLASWLHL